MRFLTILPTYLAWHYVGALTDYVRVSKNLIWFLTNFFSIGLLTETLFSPWKRLSKDEYGHSNAFTDFIVNILMRISGFFIRSATIIFGLIVTLFATLFLFVGFIFWLALPLIFGGLILYGISFFILQV